MEIQNKLQKKIGIAIGTFMVLVVGLVTFSAEKSSSRLATSKATLSSDASILTDQTNSSGTLTGLGTPANVSAKNSAKVPAKASVKTTVSSSRSSRGYSDDEGGGEDGGGSYVSAPASTPAPTPTKAPAATASVPPATVPKNYASVYKNGTYSATGSYMSPGGYDQISVTLTLANDIITSVSVTPGAGDRTSQRYQDRFIAGYQPYVIGKNIADVNLDIVSGASLTPIGFNDALSQIKAQAKV